MRLNLLDISEAASVGEVTRATIYRWIKDGVDELFLPARVLDGQTYINEEDLVEYMEDLGYEFEGENESEY